MGEPLIKGEAHTFDRKDEAIGILANNFYLLSKDKSQVEQMLLHGIFTM